MWGIETIKAIDVVRSHIGEITIPVLLIHGTSDTIVPITSSEFVYANVSSSDKTFKVHYKYYYWIVLLTLILCLYIDF